MSISTLTTDWRFVQLVVGSYLDPSLTGRYATDPHAVLAEFGIELDAHEEAPVLEPAESGVVNDQLTGIDHTATAAYSHLCWRGQSRQDLLAA